MGATTPEQATQAGANAREKGRAIDSCPMFGPGEEGYQLRAAWRRGWVAKDDELRRTALSTRTA